MDPLEKVLEELYINMQFRTLLLQKYAKILSLKNITMLFYGEHEEGLPQAPTRKGKSL